MTDDLAPEETKSPVGTAENASAPSSRPLFLTIFPSIMLPMFLAVADQTIVATALPVIAADFGDVERVSWVVVSYLIANTIAAPVYGRLGDSFGRRNMILIGACHLHDRIGLLRARAEYRITDRRTRPAGFRRRRVDDLVASAGRRNRSAARARPLSGLSCGGRSQFQHVRTGCRRLSHPGFRLAVDFPRQCAAGACRRPSRAAPGHPTGRPPADHIRCSGFAAFHHVRRPGHSGARTSATDAS